MVARGIIKAGGEIDFSLLNPPDVPGVNPDDDPFVNFAQLNQRAVNLLVVDQQDISRLEVVSPPLNHTVDLSRDEVVNFIKIVVVVIDIQRFVVRKMEEFKIWSAHHLPGVKLLLGRTHKNISFPTFSHPFLHFYSKAIFAIFQAIIANFFAKNDVY